MKPYLFPFLNKNQLTNETHVYTQRVSEETPPVDQKFTLGDIKWFLKNRKKEGPFTGFEGTSFDIGTIESDVEIFRDGVRLIKVGSIAELTHPLHYHKDGITYTFFRPAFISSIFQIQEEL